MPGYRRRFGSARGIGGGTSATRGVMRGGIGLSKMRMTRGGLAPPRVKARVPQMGLPRIKIAPFLTIQPRIQLAYFDRSIIKRNWSKINRNPIQRAANLVRIIARRSIKRRKSRIPSPVGTPPYSHMDYGGVAPPFKQIFNVPYRFGTSQIIGMTGYGTKPAVPGLHEHGGRARRSVYNRARQQIKQPRGSKGRYRTYDTPKFVTKTVRYPQRPFMMPALRKARERIPKFWINSISRRGYF